MFKKAIKYLWNCRLFLIFVGNLALAAYSVHLHTERLKPLPNAYYKVDVPDTILVAAYFPEEKEFRAIKFFWTSKDSCYSNKKSK